MNHDCPNFASQYGSTSTYYHSAIASQTRLERGNPNDNDAIDLAFAKLRVVPNRDISKLVSWEDKELISEVEFNVAPGNTITSVVTDALAKSYYEVS
jgi:hypothetical protein